MTQEQQQNLNSALLAIMGDFKIGERTFNQTLREINQAITYYTKGEESGAALIVKEREEQIDKHQRSIEYDVEFNNKFQLVDAAHRISWHPEAEGFDLMKEEVFIPEGWSKEPWLKILNKPYRDRLIIAGALIAAEIDRIDAGNVCV